ncbi:TetR/AcrR family transcriptional regulator [Paraburkholderia sp. 22B1P]|uniref:TetR/AcrR family transcriptional regulator n=1 Tax=Paraburkholderia sp. 22B1P TaxID=3080498 RepID=UPI00308F97CA|nr:TetR/AcrR family transcriptional regulator [Paraburkholderia sp. 22B1P]
MEVFQTRGYEGTSLPDLLEGTGLSRGSLYKAFGDKRTLFLAALDRYTTDNISSLRKALSEGPALEAIRSALLGIAKTSAFAVGERGCLVVGSTTEMASKDEEVKKFIQQTFSRMQRFLREAIERGQQSGDIAKRHSAETLSRFLLCTIEGMGVLGKTGRTEKEMSEIVDVALQALC